MRIQATVPKLCVKLSAALLLLALMAGLKLLGPQLAYADTPIGNCNDSGPGSLRQALIDEPADGRVYFATDCPSASPLTLSTAAGGTFLTLTKNVTIDGDGHDVVIRGDGSTNRIFNASGRQVTFKELTIDNGDVGGGGGGAMLIDAGDVTIIDSTISNHQAGFGGAIYVRNGGLLEIRNSTFTGNSATSQGGVMTTRSAGDDIIIINSTFSNNSAANGGGVIYSLNGGTIHIFNSTIFDNNGGAQGAVRNVGGAAIDFQNTLIANNTSVNCNGGNLIDNGNNLADDATCGTIPATAGPLYIDAALADNGGRTQTHALLPDSPAIDAGSDAICAGATVGNVDQRGETRTEDIPGFGTTICDIGAYEFIRPGVSIDDVTVTEGDMANFTVSLSRNIQKTIVVTYTTADNTAQSPQDYTAASGGVTIPAGGNSAPLSITTIDDAGDEPDSETFFVNLTAVSAWGVLSDTQGIGTINDNDAAVPPPTGDDDDDDDEDGPAAPPPPAPAEQVFDCWPWQLIVPPLVVPHASSDCLPSLGATLPAASSFPFLGHSTDVTLKNAGGIPVTGPFSPPLKICFRYRQSELDAVGGNPANFLIQTFHNGSWETLSTIPEADPSPSVLGRTCAQVDHLTLFALFDGYDRETTPSEVSPTNAGVTQPADDLMATVKYLPETGVRSVSPQSLPIGRVVLLVGAVALGIGALARRQR